MRKRLLLPVVCLLVTTPPAFAGLLLPHVLHDSFDLRPYGCTDHYGTAYWQNHVYVTGWYDQYGSQANVWSVDVSDPNSISFVNENKWGGGKTWKPEAYDDKLYVAAWGTGLHIFDISSGPVNLYPNGIWDPATGFFWDVDYENGRAYLLQSAGASQSSVHIVNVAGSGYPGQVSQFSTNDGVCFGISARGSYLYYTEALCGSIPDTSRACLTAYNISDEANPTFVKSVSTRHNLMDMVRRGDYLYVSWRSWGYARFDANQMPQASEPSWTLAEGSEAYASVASGILYVDDDSTAAGSKVKWRRNWPSSANDAYGSTTVFRARCLSAGGDTSGIVNVQIEDGSYRERFQLLTDRIVALDSGYTHMLTGSAWHTYRIIMKNATLKVYLDSSVTPFINGPLTATTSTKRITFGGGADAATQDIDIDYVHYNCWEDLPPISSVLSVEAGLDIYDISDRTNPALVGEYRGIGGGAELCLLGNGAFMPATNGGMLTVNITNPTAPAGVSQLGLPGYEGAISGNGRYLYVIAGDATNTYVHSLEVLDSDPDVYGPSLWSDCSLGEASWDTEYHGDSLPSASSPAWPVVSGDSESLATVASGILRVNDDSGSAKLQWVRNWNATRTFGSTVAVRARCASYDLNGAPIADLNNICIEDGRCAEEFAILSDRIRATNAGIEYAIDGTQWHTYRITTKGTQFNVYVDEIPTAALTGTLSVPTGQARIWFGTSSTLAEQDIYFDFVQCCSLGDYSVPAHTTDQTPDVSVVASDWVEQDSVSGIDPTSAYVYWSTDGGASWSPGQSIPCSGGAGSHKGTLTANAIPFNQYSNSLNKVRYSLDDMLGNTGTSPVYNVRILNPNPPGPVAGFTATEGDAHVDLSWTNPTAPQFAGVMIRYKTITYPTSPTDGTLLVNKLGSPGASENYTHTPVTNGVTYYYTAWAYDSVPSYSVAANAIATPHDTGPPASVANFAAVGADEQVSLTWTNPTSPDFEGTMIRFRTDTYPTGPTDGALLVDKPNSPGSTDGHTHNGLTNGQTYYYSAWAYDEIPNYATKADADATPAPGLCWIEQFAYGNGPLSGKGGWTNGCSDVEVIDQTLKVTGGTPECYAERDIICEGEDGIIWVRIQVKAGTGGGMLWSFWINDTAGNNLARWYGGSQTARPRIGGTSNVLPTETLTGGWDTLDVRIDTNTNEDEFFFNGVSLGTLNHGATPGDWVGEVWIGRIDNNLATGSYLWFDNVMMGADLDPPGPVTNFAATPGDSQISLSWTNPSDSDFAGTTIRCKTTGYPTGSADGTAIYSGTGANTVHSGLDNGITYYYAAYAFDEVPNYSTGANATACPIADATILEAKGLPDGQLRALRGNVVSMTGSGFLYIQDPAAYQGIKVASSEAVAVGQRLDVVGITAGEDAERYIDCSAHSVVVTDPGPISLDVSGMTLPGVGGSALNAHTPGVLNGMGPNNVGLLVRVWGEVTQRDTTGLAYFYIDDGSSLTDGTTTGGTDNVGVRVLSDPTTYPTASYVIVTGVVSLFDSAGLRRCIIPQAGGIQVLAP